MISQQLKTRAKEPYILKDKWVKALTHKASDPEELATVIENRIKSPNIHGPHIFNTQDEYSTDIICAYVELMPELRSKVQTAVGLLLFRMLYNEITETRDLLEGVFSIIEECDLSQCHILLFKWLRDKKESVFSSDDRLWKLTYRMGMIAFAIIQPKNQEIECYWKDIWASDSNYFWGAAFRGIYKCNPNYAAMELPLLISRSGNNTEYSLLGMWRDGISRSHLERAIKIGLNSKETQFAGLALNMLVDKLNEEHRDQLMTSLKG